ncbi:MAG: glycosyltransferase family 4 protein [Candidatus Bathyarchaeota archaeon]|nr:MAG: glycosyltransferase family 4 protein [Candidatus Bathyarchaeota archaeon]
MNILLATEYYHGNPRLVRFSVELAKRGHEVNVVTSYLSTSIAKYRSQTSLDYGSFSGVNIIEANPHIDILNPPYTVTFPLTQVAKLIKQRDIQICHTVMAFATTSAAVALISKGLKIPHIHEEPGVGTKTGYFLVDLVASTYNLAICRFIMKSAKRVVVLTKSQADRPLRLGANAGKIVVIPSGIDCSLFNPNRSESIKEAQKIRDNIGAGDATVLGYVGRLVPVKGVKYLLLAMKEVQKEFPNTHLLIVGEGFEKAELKEIAQTRGINVDFVGWKKDALAYYAAFDVFVLPSVQEGLSHALLEAMAMKKPAVATSTGGNKDLIENGKNGFLVPPCNPKLLSSSIKELINNDELRKKMGTLNRRIVETKFSWENTVSKFEDLYRSLLH